MPSVADQLRSERERLTRTIHDVANATNIKTDHIRALEAGDWRTFGALVYIRGFTRTYAKELRMDVPKLMAELEAELGESGEFTEPPSLSGNRKGPLDFITLWLSRMKWQWLLPIVLGVAFLSVVWIGYKTFRSNHAANKISLKASIITNRSSNLPPSIQALPRSTNSNRSNR
ncbi:MAG: helix-turn-helix domain-containing protein [Pedosphaera sp.]|nr:helix-turn-helix domain-containing protein [Pedosphaera sp.]